MRIASLSWVVVVVAAALGAGGCGGSTQDASGAGVGAGAGAGTGAGAGAGMAGRGAAGTADAAPSSAGGPSGSDGGCSSPAPCGGAVDGVWDVDAVCVEGDLATALSSAESLPEACRGLFRSASLTATGTVTFANGTETDAMAQHVVLTAVYTPECLGALRGAAARVDGATCASIQKGLEGTPTFTEPVCAFDGDDCVCSLVYDVSTVSAPQPYTVSGSTLTYADASFPPVRFCVVGNTLTEIQAVRNAPEITLHVTLRKR